jgi:hypothetical protein
MRHTPARQAVSVVLLVFWAAASVSILVWFAFMIFD